MGRFRLGMLLAAAALVLPLLGTAALAADDATKAELAAVRAQLDAQKQRMDSLEGLLRGTIAKDVAALRKEVDAVSVRADAKPFASWAEKVKFKGDFRYRHEWFDEERKDRNRARQRIRFRLGMEAHPTEDMSVYARFVTGGSDPVSTNQTLDGGFSTKGFMLDKAYVDYHPASLKGLHLLAGKLGNPLYRVSDLVWDGDLSLEGLALTYSTSVSETTNVFMNCGAFWVNENSSAEDQMLYACQMGLTQQITEDAKFTVGASHYNYYNLRAGTGVVYDPEDSFGNSATDTDPGPDKDLVYDNEFKLCEAFCKFEMKAGGLPFSLYGNYVRNHEADSGKDTGWLAGCKLGKAKTPGSWELGYNYRELEADCVIGALTDSDFNGGGTGGQGHKFSAKYQVNKAAQLACTYFLTNDISDASSEDGYKRLQLDFIVKF